MTRLGFVALGAAAFLLAACQSMVSFPNTPIRAQDSSITIKATLAKPDGKGPHPAVVLLHSCGGFQQHIVDWSSFLVDHGYAALAVDSFGSRGLRPCPNGVPSVVIAEADMVSDAYGALGYLAAQPDIAAERIYVMGFSVGGWAIRSMATREPLGQSKRTFRAGIALYAGCGHFNAADRLTFPVMVIIGTKDGNDFFSCDYALTHHRLSQLDVQILQGAYHAFDMNFGTRIRYDVGGRPMLYDPDAVKRSKALVERYLAGH